MAAKKNTNSSTSNDPKTILATRLADMLEAACAWGETAEDDKEVARRALIILHGRQFGHIAGFLTDLDDDPEYHQAVEALSNVPAWLYGEVAYRRSR